MLTEIQLGLDVATSISIVFAAISFLISQMQKRKQLQTQYAIDNLKDFLIWLHQQSLSFSRLSEEMLYHSDDSNNSDNLDKKATTKGHKESNNQLELLDLFEEISSELKIQADIFFPIFMGSPPKELIELHAESMTILQTINQHHERNHFIQQLDIMQDYLEKSVRVVSNTLKTHLAV